jgi:4-hydroxy-3-polyprenylbenzoate decarboxylase
VVGYNQPVPNKRGAGRKTRLVVGISGSTGAIYGIRLLEVLRDAPGIETHLVISKAAERTIPWETPYSPVRVRELAHASYAVQDLGAELSSGSFTTAGMVIAPCSVKTLASIAAGISDNLLARAADVTLKERRKLVLLVREAPLTLAHIRNMEAVTLMGAIVAPPVPAFYNRPQTLDDLVNHTVGRVLDLFGIDTELVKRWEGMGATRKV